ncbi:ABC transporter ATP-binding protein [Vallitalea okinawensis]|uniref:ABC transporter ATP-binding protein n=1 Tax=Vallitalea okinawensis TaxID=2078660 RepID=UPI000CFB717B|nr:ABC transporter ATP-binding protein [Vallitalea okinawensis]
MKSYINVENLTKIYDHKVVLKDVSFTLEKGRFLSIVGQSGIGKTTLLRLIAGFDEALEGNIYIDDKVIEGASMKRILVFQEFDQLFPWRTVKGNVEFALKYKGVPKEERGAKAVELLKKVGLEEAIKKYPYQLSGGMKQRVAIARALACEPEILLMDEPFGSVDVHTKEKLQKLLKTLWRQENITVLFVTHDVDEAIKMSTEILVLKEEGAVLIHNQQPLQDTDAYSEMCKRVRQEME